MKLGPVNGYENITLHSIGKVVNNDQGAKLVLSQDAAPALLGLDQWSHVWVFCWFDRNDTPAAGCRPRTSPITPLFKSTRCATRCATCRVEKLHIKIISKLIDGVILIRAETAIINLLTGEFACRAPVRPNLIAITLCQVIEVADHVVHIDGTPILDLKPYIPGSDHDAQNMRAPDWL